MSWGDVSLTLGQAFSRQILIKWLTSGDLGWGHELGQEADSLSIWYNVSLLYCIVGSYVFIFYIMFHWMFEKIMMTFKLTWHNWCRLLHVYVCRFLQGITKTIFKRDWWFWCHFVPNLSRYRWANNYFIIRRFGKVLAKIKWCSFLCLIVYMPHKVGVTGVYYTDLLCKLCVAIEEKHWGKLTVVGTLLSHHSAHAHRSHVGQAAVCDLKKCVIRHILLIWH